MATGDRDWNDDPPSTLSQPGPRLSLGPAELPEVRALLDAGWQLAPDAPVWAFLPAVWPPEHRTWVFDRSTRTCIETIETASGRTSRVVPWTKADYAEVDTDLGALCTDAGVPARPRGRLWLLRTHAGTSLSDVLERAIREVQASGDGFRPSPRLTAATRKVIDQICATGG